MGPGGNAFWSGVGRSGEAGNMAVPSGGRLWKCKDPRVEGAMNALAGRLGSTGALRSGAPRLDQLHGAVPFGGVRRIGRV